ncbi:hypothetical protein COM54_15520 [Bacillus toyonensis]|uniref:hypothetical protein n=1 Tax=Bacillus toyonensis TaxID=155322 RepID=UPI000BF958A6|nr:hypothetical protein [Bacillus toyonensis]PGE10200.1 hypothetical protein COM54_15520 [Bacillus toyonensis]
MNLLKEMDEEYKRLKTDGQIYAYNYYHYHNIKIHNEYSSNSFLCLKQIKVKFLIVEEIDKIKLYLTDADIIDLIIKLEQKLFDMLLNSFYQLYTGLSNDFKFTINDIEYISSGLHFSNSDKIMYFNTQIETKADFDISLEDLINLINLILAKEQFAMDLTNGNSINRIKRQLAKFIALSKFYRNKDNNSLKYLEQIKYDLKSDNIFLVYRNYKGQSRIDKKFDDNKLFEKYFIHGKITMRES